MNSFEFQTEIVWQLLKSKYSSMGRDKHNGRSVVQAVDEDKFTKETHVWVVKKFVLKLKFICHLLSQASKSSCRLYMVLWIKLRMNVHDLKCDIIYGIVWKRNLLSSCCKTINIVHIGIDFRIYSNSDSVRF